MYKIAFVTHSDAPDITEDDQLTADELKRRYDILVEPLSWDGPVSPETLRSFDLLVIRSTWNYYRKYEQFRAWLNILASRGIPILNPVKLMLWNADKNYLRELSEKGFPIAETFWLEKGSTVNLQELIESVGFPEVILKPVVSAGAWQTWRIPAEEAASYQEKADEILATNDAILQPFFKEIIDEGEYSLTFFGDKYSHTTLKQPDNGDYRVQREHGGSYYATEANEEWIKLGEQLIQALPYSPLYTRLDGIRRNGKFEILEVELLEPDLYTRFHEGAPTRFADAIVDRIEQFGTK